MSRSHHVNGTHLRGYSKTELNDMATDPDSILSQWMAKKIVIKTEEKGKKIKKQIPH